MKNNAVVAATESGKRTRTHLRDATIQQLENTNVSPRGYKRKARSDKGLFCQNCRRPQRWNDLDIIYDYVCGASELLHVVHLSFACRRCGDVLRTDVLRIKEEA